MKFWQKVLCKPRHVLAVMGCLIWSISAAAGGISGAQQADNLEVWKAETSALVSRMMHSPKTLKSLHDSQQVVEMLIRHDGTILSAELVQKGSESQYTTPATEACLAGLGRLPALPVDFADDTARVRLNLIYATSRSGRDRMIREINRHRALEPAQLIPGGISIIELAASR